MLQYNEQLIQLSDILPKQWCTTKLRKSYLCEVRFYRMYLMSFF